MRRPVDSSRIAPSVEAPHPADRADMTPQELRLALARLPGQVREATRLFRELTGFAAVTSFRSTVTDLLGSSVIAPPMHPLCASRQRGGQGEPCEGEWQRHLQSSLHSRAVQRHVCSLGLCCSCIPIYYRTTLLGVAKCVTAVDADHERFSDAMRILELVVAKTCRDFHLAVQSDELGALRNRLGQLQEIHTRRGPGAKRGRSPASNGAADDSAAVRRSVVDRALDHIALHYLEHDETLSRISGDLGVTEKYLTNLFTRVVGQHMHAYILQLRVQHACQLILVTEKSIKLVAYESGFNGADAFRRSFRRYVGATPAAYRSAFARG